MKVKGTRKATVHIKTVLKFLELPTFPKTLS